MSGDYTRFTDKPRKRYAGVLMQQGRVQLDADWNEQTEIVKRRWQVQATDTFGHCAVPKHTTPDAFKVTPTGGSPNLTLGEGRIYVEGLIAEIMTGERFKGDPITYRNQPFYPTPPALPANGNAIVYLDVWEREVTYIEDPELLEVALGGPDTATRVQTVWQVKVHGTATSPAQCRTDLNALFPPSGGRLTTRVIAPPASDDPCIISPSGGYRGLENRLYRVEIQTGGTLATAKFKWSRENASVVASVKRIDIARGQSTLTVTRIGRDKVLRFQQNNWVEVTDDNLELMGQAGRMARIVSIDEANLKITLDRDISAGGFDPEDPTRHTRLRRWDQTDNVDGDGLVLVSNAFILLEDGIEVSFNIIPAGQQFKVGDYWVFAARTATGSVEELTDAPPRGIIHNYCQLAAVTGLGTSTPQAQDCRPLWPPDTGTCDCCCTITVGAHGKEVGDFPDLPSAIAALPTLAPDTEKRAQICLLPGTYMLTAPVVITRPRTTIKGCGPEATIIKSSVNIFRVDAPHAILEEMSIEFRGGGGTAQAIIALTQNGDNCLIRGNQLRTSDGNAIETLQEVERLEILNNDIFGIGSVYVGADEMLIAGNEMGMTLRIKVGSSRVRIEKNRLTGPFNPIPGGSNFPPAIVLGANQVPTVPRTSWEIDVVDNQIENALGSAIVCGRFNRQGIDESEILGLRIIGNRITNCARNVSTLEADAPAAGGIILTMAEHLVIRDNFIANNGTQANVPVCGIFVRHNRGMEISGNRILNNGRLPGGTPITGPQGGIVAQAVSVVAIVHHIPGTPGVPAQNVWSIDGFPAALIANNIVSARRGHALHLVGIGPMLIHGNSFTSYDLVARGGAGASQLDGLVGAVLVMNYGTSTAFYKSFAAYGFNVLNSVVDLSTGGQEQDIIGGKVEFVDNQVILDLSHPDTDTALAAIALFSMDDINASDNQTTCIVPANDILLFDMLVGAITTRQTSNGLTESPARCAFSLLSIGYAMNTCAQNQGTHCIGSLGARHVDRDNLVLLPNPYICPRKGSGNPIKWISLLDMYNKEMEEHS